MRLITEAKYATLVDLLAARRPFNVHFCPPRLLSALRFADLRACAAVIYIIYGDEAAIFCAVPTGLAHL